MRLGDVRHQVALAAERLYDAALAPQLWSDAVEQVRRLTTGTSAVFFSQRLDTGTFEFFHTAATIPDLIQEYRAHFWQQDPWAERAIPILKPGAVVSGYDLIAPDMLRRTAFYNEHMAKYGWCDIDTNNRERIAAFSLHRFGKTDDASVDDRRVLSLVAPHLLRAFSIEQRLRSATQYASGLEAMLDRLQVGAVLLNQQGNTRSQTEQRRSCWRTPVSSAYGVTVSGLLTCTRRRVLRRRLSRRRLGRHLVAAREGPIRWPPFGQKAGDTPVSFRCSASPSGRGQRMRRMSPS
jgi:hypothetical protein